MPKPDSAWAEPSEVVLGAMKQAQKCLSLALVYHDRRTTIARREHGMAMFFLLPPVPATLFGAASYYPIELCAEIGRQCALRLRAAREIRITSRRGTDFRALLDPRNCTADPGGWLEAWDPGRVIGRTPGEGSNTFPPGVVLAYPDPGSVEGVAVFEHHVGVGPVAQPPRRPLRERPLRRRAGRGRRDSSPRSSTASTTRPTSPSSPGARTRTRR